MKSVVCFIVLSFGLMPLFAQDRIAESSQSAELMLTKDDSLLFEHFADAFSLYAQQLESDYQKYYFTTAEAERFNDSLMKSQYPGAGPELVAAMIERNALVSERLLALSEKFKNASVGAIEKRFGHDNMLQGYIVSINFSNDGVATEEVEILFTVFEGSLKILTLKDEK